MPPRYFIGREKALVALGNTLSEHNIFLLSGEGGIGKTSLASKFLYEEWKTKNYAHIAWFSAQNGMANAILNLAYPLQLQFDKEDESQQFARILQVLVNLKTAFLVFDNADNADDLRKHYKTLCRLPNCKILITTRNTDLPDAHFVHLEHLSTAKAAELFKHHYNALTETEEAELLPPFLKAVGYNTLVIELLAKNLTVFNKFEATYSLQKLIDDFRAKGLLGIKTTIVDTHYHDWDNAKPDTIISAMYDVASLKAVEKQLL